MPWAVPGAHPGPCSCCCAQLCRNVDLPTALLGLCSSAALCSHLSELFSWPCSVPPQIFCLLSCASCSAPSTEERGFSKSVHCPPQAWEQGLGCRQQHPSWDGSRHTWGSRWGNVAGTPMELRADPALAVAPTQRGSSTGDPPVGTFPLLSLSAFSISTFPGAPRTGLGHS